MGESPSTEADPSAPQPEALEQSLGAGSSVLGARGWAEPPTSHLGKSLIEAEPSFLLWAVVQSP